MVGNITSIPSVTIGARSTISGTIKSGGTISGAPTGVTANQNQSIASSTLKWKVPFDTSSSTVTLSTGSKTLPPGSYGNVQINGGTLNLGAGTYYIDTLNLQSGSNLVVNNATAPVFLYVKTALTFRTKLTGTPDNLMLVYLGTAATAIETTFQGTFVAPNAAVRFGVGGAPHVGSIFANSILLDPDVKFTQRAFAHWDLVSFDAGITPTLNCVTQLDSATYGAVFGYTNTTGANVTLGAGSHNLFAPGDVDRGQPILFVPGQVPIANIQTFSPSSQLTWTVGSQSATASSTSPTCSAELNSALQKLYLSNSNSVAIRNSVVGIFSNPNFGKYFDAIKTLYGPQLTPFQSAAIDAIKLVIANTDLLGEPSTLTASQLARIAAFRSAVLSNPAVVSMRVAGDALRGNPTAFQCKVISTLNGEQPTVSLVQPQSGSLNAQVQALAHSKELASLQAVIAEIASGTQYRALFGASGLMLAGLIPSDVAQLQLLDPILTSLLGKIFAVAGGVVAGAAVGFVTGGPLGAVAGGIIGGAVVYFGSDAMDADSCTQCTSSAQCGDESSCAGMCCTEISIFSTWLLSSNGCPSGEQTCTADSQCAVGSLCNQGCCVASVSLCPGALCSSDAQCSGGNTCQNGCCANRCGVFGQTCNEFVSTTCGIPATTCPADNTCKNGCCQAPDIILQ